MNKASSSVALHPDLRASWQRSHAHGLQTGQALPLNPINRADLSDRLASNARLLTFSQPVIDNLLRQIDNRDATVLLTDNQGLILSASGDPHFLDRAARVALSPGAAWSEADMGTNAIGTALAIGDIAAVRGHEHFLERNRFLSCVAIPILAPTGGIAGILDISTDASANLQHANALLRTTAEIIEHRLVESMDDGFVSVRFHQRHELLGSPLESIVVFDEGGRVIACNRNARTMLGLHDEYPDASCEDCFAITWRNLLDWAALDQNTPFPLRTLQGQTWAARASLRQRGLGFGRRRNNEDRSGRRSTPPDTLQLTEAHASAQDSPPEDGRIAAARALVRQWAAGTGPLLIAGETGTGKHALISTYQREFAADLALVQIDGRALAAQPSIATEVVQALQLAAHSILYLCDIDALPLPHQARIFDAATAGTRRIVVATRRSLDALVEDKRLDRRALLRSGGLEIQLPPLRERTDFDALVRDFVRQEIPDRPMYVCPDALTLLRKHHWPGNLSELHNRLRLILALMGDEAGQLCPDDIPEELLEQVSD